jgi:hypothetical protein
MNRDWAILDCNVFCHCERSEAISKPLGFTENRCLTLEVIDNGATVF